METWGINDDQNDIAQVRGGVMFCRLLSPAVSLSHNRSQEFYKVQI